ncbi:hypothetical protein [Methylocystis sp. ATCC 49242]|uniref:hypothetical protein n=1 Tax=Methylocystis sp. ATCC 49242 TaxID=622637 RepID=UPI0001F86AE8|nr:hypothetical protein [Methylocystis sp. ATCC 49242]
MRNELIRVDGDYDHAAILRDAHRQFRVMGRHGWSFSRCLAYSWTRARAQRDRASWGTVENAAQAALAIRLPALAF